MRIILIGQAAFAEKVFAGLHANGHEVVAVYCPPDAPGGKPDPLKSAALAAGVPVRQHKSLKDPVVQREFEELAADLGVLAYVTQIVPPNVFSVPRLGSICFHPSLLPRYRGGSAIPWQVIRGEQRSGVTVFWVDSGIDTGPILLRKEASISADDTAGSLYFNKLFPIGVDAVLEAVQLIAGGIAPRQPQDEAQASYDPLCRDEHARIDWQRPVQEVYNLIRGCDPQPGAYSIFRGQKLRLYDCQCVVSSGHQPGVVESVSADGVQIGAAGGAVIAKRVRAGDAKVEAARFAQEHALGVGTSLGND